MCRREGVCFEFTYFRAQNYLLTQTELFGHFAAGKFDDKIADAAAAAAGDDDDDDGRLTAAERAAAIEVESIQ